jgi:hypothetical protein
VHASARGGGGSSGLQPWSGVRTLITHARRVLSDVSVWYVPGAPIEMSARTSAAGSRDGSMSCDEYEMNRNVG